MFKKIFRNDERMRRHVRVRTRISGTPECPRLNVFHSSNNIHAQTIDDVSGVTLASASSVELKLENSGDVEATKIVGVEIVRRAIEKNIAGVIFDYGRYVHTGCVKVLAGATRVAGLKSWEVIRTEHRPGRNRGAEKGFGERVVTINRITKVVKGGRRSRFTALIVTGDKKGHVGLGTGKANEVPDIVKRAIEDTKKNAFTVPVVGTTISHAITGRYGAEEVLLRPASEGTGVIAGGSVRAVLELTGINDILSKCPGSRTPINTVRVTISALKDLETIEGVARLHGKKPEEVRG